MPPADTILGGFVSAFSFFGDVVLKWMPAAIVTFAHTLGSDAATTSSWAAIANPIAASDFPGFLEQASTPGAYNALAEGWKIFMMISFLASIPFLGIVLYGWLRILQIRRAEARAFVAAQRTVAAEDIPKTQLRWNRVIEQAASDTPEKQRLAILEADIMLNELLDIQAYRGETIADKMKHVDRADFNTIDIAWEAHKARNAIAHEGAAHTLSPRDVRKVIDMYERVFREFHFIQ